MSNRVTTSEASIITGKDGSGMRYFTDIRFSPEHGIPLSWHKEDAFYVRKDGVVDDLARQLAKAWPTLKVSVQRVAIRELR